MHVLAIIFLVVLVLAGLAIKAVLEWLGVVKPTPLVPTGVPIGGRAQSTFRRDTREAEKYAEAQSRMTTVLHGPSGEVYRVIDSELVIDNRIRFVLVRVG